MINICLNYHFSNEVFIHAMSISAIHAIVTEVGYKSLFNHVVESRQF